jgi:uncharacterized membrane protein YedE/YeeE
MKRYIRALVSLLSGVLFGIGMTVSGMVFPQKVTAFLDVAGQWDPSLIFVMGGALLVFMPSYFFIIKPRKAPILGESFSYSTLTRIDRRLVTGAGIFGIGWGLAGVCPGPIVTSLSFGDSGFWVFFVSMMIGLGTTNRAFERYTEIRNKPQTV